jgi:hypothetical protein
VETAVSYLFILVVLNLLFPSAQGDANAVFAQANAAYTSADYGTAIRLYTDLVNDGVNQDGALFFNLGNAYYQAGDAGRALLNYRRAQGLIPRDGDLNQNMARVRSERVDLESDESGLLEGLAAFTASFMTLTELAWLSWFLWVTGFALLITAIVRPLWREMLRSVLIVAGVLVGLGIILLFGRLAAARLRPPAIVVEKIVQAMSGPGEQYLELYELHAAAELSVVDTRGGWVRFHLPDGREGWIPSTSIERV